MILCCPSDGSAPYTIQCNFGAQFGTKWCAKFKFCCYTLWFQFRSNLETFETKIFAPMIENLTCPQCYLNLNQCVLTFSASTNNVYMDNTTVPTALFRKMVISSSKKPITFYILSYEQSIFGGTLVNKRNL